MSLTTYRSNVVAREPMSFEVSPETLPRILRERRRPIAVVGLGYVGLPLATLLSRLYDVIGFDIKSDRVEELRRGFDRTGEVEAEELRAAQSLRFTDDPRALTEAPLVIVAVPTPVDEARVPDFRPLVAASETIGRFLAKGATVVYESTVFPGLTESVCAAHLASASGLVPGRDFFLGYSPERVNPGDKNHTIERSVKVVAGQTAAVTDALVEIYGSVVKAGVHAAPSIATAEAAKVIENAQRDLNIALVNELAMLFDHIGLDTNAVIDAARTKYNFMDVRPGLVGGHCISVDPYYLTYLADTVGYQPHLIRAGRAVNESMSSFIAQKTLSLALGAKARSGGGAELTVGILGVTFKEDVPDLRNSKVPEVAKKLERSGVRTFLVDPLADGAEFEREFERRLTPWIDLAPCDAVVLAVKHACYVGADGLDLLSTKLTGPRVVVDLRGALDAGAAKARGMVYWRP